jgi:starch phosphorylase
VRVELYADGLNGGTPVRQEMKRGQPLVGAANSYVFDATMSATRPAADYTARVIPCHDSVAIPLEESNIRWQR